MERLRAGQVASVDKGQDIKNGLCMKGLHLVMHSLARISA